MNTNYNFSNNISYHYGRLLSLYDAWEKAGRSANTTSRSTIAESSIPAYTTNASKTRMLVFNKIRPYIRNLDKNSPKLSGRYKEMHEEITNTLAQFSSYGTTMNLSEMFWIGYYDQRKEIYKKSESNTTENS